MVEEVNIDHVADDLSRAYQDGYNAGYADALAEKDVRPVVRGKWIDCDDKYYGWNMWACSACGEEFILTEGTPDMNEYHFCPNCGADMRPEQAEEET